MKQKLYSGTFFGNCVFYEILWENILELEIWFCALHRAYFYFHAKDSVTRTRSLRN